MNIQFHILNHITTEEQEIHSGFNQKTRGHLGDKNSTVNPVVTPSSAWPDLIEALSQAIVLRRRVAFDQSPRTTETCRDVGSIPMDEKYHHSPAVLVYTPWANTGELNPSEMDLFL